MNWSISYSNYDRALEDFFENYDPDFMRLKTSIKEILQEEEDLTEIVQLVGKDSLSEDQKTVLEVSDVICNIFRLRKSLEKISCNKTLSLHMIIPALFTRQLG